MFVHTIIIAVLFLLSPSVFSSDEIFSYNFSPFRSFHQKNTAYLYKTIEPSLKGEQVWLSQETIEVLKGKDNVALFNSCSYGLRKANNPHTSVILSSLFGSFFEAEFVCKQLNHKRELLLRLKECPEVLNKALFTLKVPPCKKQLNVALLSEMLEKAWYVDSSEVKNLEIEDQPGCFFINQNFFRHSYTSKPYLKSMRQITKEEKDRYWQSSLIPTFYPECIKHTIRENAQILFLTLHRLKKEKAITIDKRLFLTKILPLVFEEELISFKSHCNIVEFELNKQIVLEKIEDPEQKPFFTSFKEWYAQEKDACFKELDTVETLQKIIRYKFSEKK